MKRGWEVELADGTIIREDQMDWNRVPSNKIVRLTLRFEGREWNITGKENYIQKKRASMIPFKPESFRVESRSIGYYDNTGKVWYTVNENTGKVKVEVEDI
jgi:hypothetical protein